MNINSIYINYLLEYASKNKFLKNSLTVREFETFTKWITNLDEKTIELIQEKTISDVSKCIKNKCEPKYERGSISKNEYTKCVKQCAIAIKNKKIGKLESEKGQCQKKNDPKKCKNRIDDQIRKLKIDIDAIKRR